MKKDAKNIYLLSAGVGLATFRPLILEYFERPGNIEHMHSLNIDSSREFIFTDIVTSNSERNFTAQFVDHRNEYYETVKKLAIDKNGVYYVVGSDEFLKQNIEVLKEQGIRPNQIVLDKHEHKLQEFLSLDYSK